MKKLLTGNQTLKMLGDCPVFICPVWAPLWKMQYKPGCWHIVARKNVGDWLWFPWKCNGWPDEKERSQYDALRRTVSQHNILYWQHKKMSKRTFDSTFLSDVLNCRQYHSSLFSWMPWNPEFGCFIWFHKLILFHPHMWNIV